MRRYVGAGCLYLSHLETIPANLCVNIIDSHIILGNVIVTDDDDNDSDDDSDNDDI